MLAANFLKLCAICAMVVGVDPALAIAVAGLGAAIYAPAKYGLITELLPSSDLVRANGFFESVTVCAVIFGTALGGLLVSPLMPNWVLPTGLADTPANTSALLAGMLAVVGMNALATLMSVAVADSGARYLQHTLHPVDLFRRFCHENMILWRDPLGGLSMTVTTLLWGVGATLQLIVLRWANEALGFTLTQAAYLQGVTALGVIVGAILASRFVRLDQATALLPVGILIGLLVPVMLVIQSTSMAVVLLVAVGVLAGFFVVPMNAMLQHRGCHLLTAGRSIAVQGFNENGGMLLMLACYALGTASGTSLGVLVWTLGGLVAVGMSGIYVTHQRGIAGHCLPKSS